MEPETGAFNQLQLSRRSRSKSSIWRAKDVEAASIGPASRRSTVRNSVVSVADMWAQTRPKDSADSSRTSLDRNPSLTSISTRGQELRRWDGVKRATTSWDEIRRDPELWFPDGDVFIHFYGRGSSRRGPSLRMHRDDLENSGCMNMLSKFADNALIEEDEEEEFSPIEDDVGPDGGFRTNPNTRGKDELFIPAPPLLNRDEALKFHVTTRNFFACLYEKPMVGAHLGESLVLVHERFNMYRPDKERNRDDMLQYCDDQGYTDFRDCPDHAMAMMYYSEKLRETDLWTEAFVHCVGMYDILNTAVEFPTVSRTIGALITRAHLEMTLRLEHAYADLGGFMEDSITSAYPKLPEPALKHLERFRGFLQSFYVQQHGYWPPPSLEPGADFSVVTKSLLRSMYTDLRNLYQFLRDPKSDAKPTQSQIETYKAIYGGICTPQFIGGFDRRFKHTPLPNGLPLLPSGTSGEKSPAGSSHALSGLDLGASAKPSSGNAFARFLRPSKKKSAKALNTLNMLSAATNTNDPNVMDSLLVQEYSRFERDWTVRGEEKYDACEARKVRWLLIYALLQTVIGVIAVPREVSNVEKVEYPVCVQTGGTPPWRKRVKVKAYMDGTRTPILEALSTASSPAASPYLTPVSPAARSGAITPISAADSIPPVPQLVLSELDKLNQRTRSSFGSDRDSSHSPLPPGSSADSIRSSGTARPGRSALKSSSASIMSNGSTRSSFSGMMNRSFAGGLGGAYADIPPASPKPKREKPVKEPKVPTERPPITKQKTAPPAVHTAPVSSSKKLVKNQRTSMFSWNRSRQGSPNRAETPVDRSFMASPAPSSPAQSTFSNARNSVRFDTMPREETETPATSEFPQSATSTGSAQLPEPLQQVQQPAEQAPQTVQQTPQETPRAKPRANSRLAPLSTIGAEPERGRSTHAPYSPTAVGAAAKKVRNFSRGRSMERPSPVSPVNAELPPPVPAATKPASRTASPEPSPASPRVYTSAGVPPQLPTLTKPPSRSASQVRSPEPDKEEFYDAQSPPPMPMFSKPRSRAQSMSHSPERELGDELPPPLPNHSKPGSRSQSPAPMAEQDRYTDATVPPPMPLSTKPPSRKQSVSSPLSAMNQVAEEALPPPMPNHSKPNSRSASISRPAQINTQASAEQVPPPIPSRSKPNTRPTSPARSPAATLQPDTKAQAIQSPAQSVRSPTYESAIESPAVDPYSPVATASQKSRSNSRSMALRPPPPTDHQTTPVPHKSPAIQNIRPASNISEGTASAEPSHSGSVSPVSASSDSPGTSAEASAVVHSPSSPSKTSVTARREQLRQQSTAERLNSRAPATAERTHFVADDRSTILEEDTDDDFAPHAVTAPGDIAEAQWPLGPGTKTQPVPQTEAKAQPFSATRGAPQPVYQQALREAEERRARAAAPTTAASGAVRTSSRESRYRRAAWADLGPRNDATGMPVPPPQVRQYAAPIVRDAGGAPRYRGPDDDELTSSEDEGVNGGFGSYGVRKGIMG